MINLRKKLCRKNDPFNFDIPSKVFHYKSWREKYSKLRREAYLVEGEMGQFDMWEDIPHVHNGKMRLMVTNYHRGEDRWYDFVYNKETKKVEVTGYFICLGQAHKTSDILDEQLRDEIKKLKKYMQMLINRRLKRGEK